MIKLTRNDRPGDMTEEFVATKTQLFILSKSGGRKTESVWNVGWLKKALFEMSHHKCAYCECSDSHRSVYLEVEHFHDKSSFPDKVLEWENLLPACKTCNDNKGKHNVIEQPIINPCIDNPRDHLYIKNYRLKHKTLKGRTTIKVLDLNDTTTMCDARYSIGKKLYDKIQQLLERKTKYEEQPAIAQRRNKLVNLTKEILKLCQPSEEFSATCATIVHEDVDFAEIVEFLNERRLWDDELNTLYDDSRAIALFERIPEH